MRLFEVNPHNYDSDWDYYDALKRQGRKPRADDFDPEDELERRRANRPMSQDEIEGEIADQRQKAQAKFAEKRKVEWVNKEGHAPNGERYNKLYVIDAVDENTAAHEVYLFDKHEWGAKHTVDIRRSKGPSEQLPVRYTMYIVDNHKHGHFTPFPGEKSSGGHKPTPQVKDE
mgnify:FL=1